MNKMEIKTKKKIMNFGPHWRRTKRKTRLPNRITYTVTETKTGTPYDAFADALERINQGKYSAKVKEIARDARRSLCGNGSLTSLCHAAYDIIQDAPAVYREQIFDAIPEEVVDLLDERFF